MSFKLFTNIYIRYRFNISWRSEHYDPINKVGLATRLNDYPFTYLKDHMYRALITCLMYKASSELEVSTKIKHQASLVSERAVAEEGSHSSRYWLWRVEGRNESVAIVKDMKQDWWRLLMRFVTQSCISSFINQPAACFYMYYFIPTQKQICWE